MCLCCLVYSIEETGIERQIGPYRSAGVKKQWHYGKAAPSVSATAISGSARNASTERGTG